VDETDEVFNTLPTDSEDEGFDDEAPPPGQEKTKKRKKSKPNQKIRKRMKLLKEEQGMAEEMAAE